MNIAAGERMDTRDERSHHHGRASIPWLVLLAVVPGAVLRFATMDVQSFGHDEAVTAGRVLMPGLADTLAIVDESERAPHLYYLVAWLWSRPFGVGEVGLRSLSALLGTATIPFAYLAARTLVSRRAAGLTAWLVAVSPFLIFYAQEARAYALVAFFGTVALWFFARALREPRVRDLAGWALVSCLALSTHYFAVFPFLAEAAILLWRAGNPVRVALFASLPIVAGAVLLPLALDQGGAHDAVMSSMPSYRDLATVVVQFAAGERLGVRGVYTLTPAMGALLLAGLAALIIVAGRQRCIGAVASGLVGVAAFVGPPLLAAVGGDQLAGEGIVSAKNAIGAVVPLSILAGFGLSLLSKTRLQVIAVATICGVMATSVVASNFSSGLQRPDWRAVANAVDTSAPQAVVVSAGGDDPMLYYLRRRHATRMPTNGARVREVALALTAPGAIPTILASRELALSRERSVGKFTLSEYRASHPVALTPEQLKVRPDQTVLVLNAPGSR